MVVSGTLSGITAMMIDLALQASLVTVLLAHPAGGIIAVRALLTVTLRGAAKQDQGRSGGKQKQFDTGPSPRRSPDPGSIVAGDAQ